VAENTTNATYIQITFIRALYKSGLYNIISQDCMGLGVKVLAFKLAFCRHNVTFQ